MINLFPRFYENQEGLVLLDGIDIRAMKLANLRDQFALVSQDVVLFNDTVFNNIAYGALRNTSEEKVIAAAKAAHAWEFIQDLPLGLQSEIGDRGVRLSGGQSDLLFSFIFIHTAISVFHLAHGGVLFHNFLLIYHNKMFYCLGNQ